MYKLLTQMGYREGLEHGKLETMQAGFDQGYNTTGAPLGRVLGEMRGAAEALLFIVEQRRGHTSSATPAVPKAQTDAYDELRTLCTELEHTRLEDLAEPDWEAVEHEAHHHGTGAAAATIQKKRDAFAARGDRVTSLQNRLASLTETLIP